MTTVREYQDELQKRLYAQFETELLESPEPVVLMAWIGTLVSHAVHLAAIAAGRHTDLDFTGEVIDELREVFGRRFPGLPASRTTTATVETKIVPH